MADKYKIIEEETNGIFDQHEVDITGLSNGIDRYMKETCLELLDYVAKKIGWMQWRSTSGASFISKEGEVLSKEQLFENFL
jgi:hypothetical protein